MEETQIFISHEKTHEGEEQKSETAKTTVVVLDRIIKWCVYIFVALMPLWFLPFTINVLGLNKQILMIVVLTIALIAWLGKLLTQEKIEWYKGLIVLPFLFFVVINVLATIFSIRPYGSLMGFDTHLSRALINTIYFFIFFLLVTNYEAEKPEKKNVAPIKFLTIFLISAAAVGIIGFLQILKKFVLPWDFARTASFNTIGTLTSLGIFLSILLPLALSLLFSIKQRGQTQKEKITISGFKIFLGALFLLGLSIILLLNFRILWIVTAVGMAIIASFWLGNRRALPAQSLGWLAIPVIIMALCLIFILFRPGITFDLNLPAEVGLSYSGGWNIVKEIIQRSPILGTGPETFVYNYSLFKPAAINQTVFWNLRFVNAPNEVFTLLSEIGILGILALASVIIVFLLNIFRDLTIHRNNQDQLIEIKIGLFSGWLALMVSWFLYPQNTALLFVFWLFLALLTILSSKKEDVKTFSLKIPGKIAPIISFTFIVSVIIGVGFLYLGSSKFIAEARYRTGLSLINEGDLDAGINKIVKATIANPYEDRFYRALAQSILVQINQDIQDPNLDSQDKASKIQMGVSRAINSAIRTTDLDSKDVSNWIIRGLVYRNLIPLVNGAGGWAIKSYETALTLEPTNPFIYLEMGRTYVNGADLLLPQVENNASLKTQVDEYLNKAIEAYNNAINSKSNYAPAHFELALIYNRQGKANEAIARMEQSLLFAPQDEGIAFQLGVLYYKNSRFEKAKAALLRAVSLNADFSNARYFLGLLFDKEGNKAAAIEQFEKIAQLNPDNEHVRDVLENLRTGKPALGSAELGPPKQPGEIPIQEEQPEEIESRFPRR